VDINAHDKPELEQYALTNSAAAKIGGRFQIV
jgi:hypothetical protein